MRGTAIQRGVAWRLPIGLAIVAVFALPLPAQLAAIAHFVAPAYPALARQAMISGQAALKLMVAKDGAVTGMSEGLSSHPLLAQEARTCAGEWRFQPAAHERTINVVFYYGFSGTTKESNPVTTIKADFEASSVRVYITTDPAPIVHP